MTRGEIRALGLRYIGEPNVARFGLDFVDQQADIAQTVVQGDLLSLNTRFWYQDGRFTWPTNARSVDLADVLDYKTRGRPYQMLSHGTLPQDADVSPTNAATPFTLVAFNQVGTGASDGRYYPVEPGGTAYKGAWTGARMRVAFQGQRAFANPIPQSSIYCYFEWVPILPGIPTGTEGDAVEVLGGVLAEHHVLVAIRLGIELQIVRNGNPENLLRLYADHWSRVSPQEQFSKATPMKTGGKR
mgnify:CR=1 FL=1